MVKYLEGGVSLVLREIEVGYEFLLQGDDYTDGFLMKRCLSHYNGAGVESVFNWVSMRSFHMIYMGEAYYITSR
jgi:hypothetical protein